MEKSKYLILCLEVIAGAGVMGTSIKGLQHRFLELDNKFAIRCGITWLYSSVVPFFFAMKAKEMIMDSKLQ